MKNYGSGYIIRLFPEQYFQAPGRPKDVFVIGTFAWIKVGENAFMNYRFHDKLQAYPPLSGWSLRALEKEGQEVNKRGKNVPDTGHYTLRIPKHGQQPKRYEGAVQGVFAPEYATEEVGNGLV